MKEELNHTINANFLWGEWMLCWNSLGVKEWVESLLKLQLCMKRKNVALIFVWNEELVESHFQRQLSMRRMDAVLKFMSCRGMSRVTLGTSTLIWREGMLPWCSYGMKSEWEVKQGKVQGSWECISLGQSGVELKVCYSRPYFPTSRGLHIHT